MIQYYLPFCQFLDYFIITGTFVSGFLSPQNSYSLLWVWCCPFLSDLDVEFRWFPYFTHTDTQTPSSVQSTHLGSLHVAAFTESLGRWVDLDDNSENNFKLWIRYLAPWKRNSYISNSSISCYYYYYCYCFEFVWLLQTLVVACRIF